MRGVSKPLLACLLAALLAFGIVACGDDGGDTAGSESTATTTQETPGSGAPDDGGSEQADGGSAQGGSGSSDDGEAADGDAPEEASAVFRTPGGDNSIQNFGKEADAEEFEAATAALSGFLEARADSDWAAQCEYLSAATARPLEQLAARSVRLKGKDCGAILEALSGDLPASTRVNTLTNGVASLRIEGERAFALYHGPKGVDYFMPMVRENGEWKVGSLAPTEFP